jgi:hypothetical protein
MSYREAIAILQVGDIDYYIIIIYVDDILVIINVDGCGP